MLAACRTGWSPTSRSRTARPCPPGSPRGASGSTRTGSSPRSSAAAAYTASRFAGRPLFVLAAPDALREFDGQHLLTRDEAEAAPADDRGRGHRRRWRRSLVPQPRHRLPPDPRRCGVPRDAPQPVVADAERTDARRRGGGRRPRVRDRDEGDRPRQALAGRVPAGARRPPRGSRSAGPGRGRRDGRRRPGRRCPRGAARRSARHPGPDRQDRVARGRPAQPTPGSGRRTSSPGRWPTSSPR